MSNTIADTAATLTAMLPEGIPADIEAALTRLNPNGVVDEHPLRYDAGVAFELACRLVAQTQGTDRAEDALSLSKWTHMCCATNTIPDNTASDMDIVESMLRDMLSITTWNLVPYTFLYEAYVKHMAKIGLFDRVLGRNGFLMLVKATIKTMPDWRAMESNENNVYVAQRMPDDDPILDAYGMRGWYATCPTDYHRGLVRET